jgi:hypothetical protein
MQQDRPGPGKPDRPAVYERQGTWWGEDDDMIFVDDDTDLENYSVGYRFQ